MSYFPPKLKKGDHIRIIAPAGSLSMIEKTQIEYAKTKLEEIGLRVTFGENVYESDKFISSKITSRIHDLHTAFQDENVNGILSVIGGFNSNQLLSHIDYDLIKTNPKIFCGYSDITALENAIYAKTDLVTYSGPHFTTFGMLKGLDYTVQYFKKCLFNDEPFEVIPSKEWSEDAFWLNQEERVFIPNKGVEVIQEGEAEGVSLGGNLCTFQLLHGTEYMPNLKDSIIFLEQDVINSDYFVVEFDRDFQSLIHQKGFDGVRGIVIGRMNKNSKMSIDLLRGIIESKGIFHIPVVYGYDFGHTTPHITVPIGGKVSLHAKDGEVKLKFLEF
jgi:muramoyltetrapeptide carboxypeptidase LdcA involved in peptidoglycan recycling